MSVNQLVKQIKENQEDFEWYPTTDVIVDAVAKYLSSKDGEVIHSILDIGCGNGSFFEKLDKTEYFYDPNKSGYDSRKLVRNYKKYGIEKSNILAEQLPEDVILLGSDFYTNTLIDKKVDVIFCNPPYSDYETWVEKIILQGNAEELIFVTPNRWQHSERIKYAIEKRKMETFVIGTFDFKDAERVARCTVDVYSVHTKGVLYGNRRYKGDTTDPFDTWFEETFKFNAEKSKSDTYYEEQKKTEAKKNEIIANGDTAEMLVKFYNDDMEKLYNNYRSLEKLDPEIFAELKVDVNMLKESLKSRLQGLKQLYWDMLFKKYDKITCRLTTEGKKRVIQKLQDDTTIDFTLENIFQLTMWIIRHSNTLYDEQLTDFFFKLCDTENIERYKSNKRWNDDEWKYLKEHITEYGRVRKDRVKTLKFIQLDYRIVVTAWKNFDCDWSKSRLSEDCIDFLYDLSVIAENLGFDVNMELPENEWEDVEIGDWTNKNIYTKDGQLFCNIKLYKNGNRHLKFNPDFMKKLNVEMARINGWIQNKEEAEEELGLNRAEIERFWNSNNQISLTAGNLLSLPSA